MKTFKEIEGQWECPNCGAVHGSDSLTTVQEAYREDVAALLPDGDHTCVCPRCGYVDGTSRKIRVSVNSKGKITSLRAACRELNPEELTPEELRNVKKVGRQVWREIQQELRNPVELFPGCAAHQGEI